MFSYVGVRKNVIPEVKMIEVKAGKNISLICKDFHSNHHNPVNNGITWDQLVWYLKYL